MATNPRTNNYSYRIPVFDGGLNTKYTDTNTPPNQATDLQNVDFDDYGAVGTTYGYSVLNTTPIGSAAIDGLHSYVNNSGNRDILAACDGSIWRHSGVSFNTLASSQDLYTAGVDAQFLTVNNYAWVTNGYVKPYKYNGTDFIQVGVSAPVSGAASALSTPVSSYMVASGGSLTGDYIWYITGVNSAGVEGDYAPILSAALTLSDGEATITGIPEFPVSSGVDTKYLYRNTAGAAGIPYRVTALTNGVTAYSDNIADTQLVTDAPADNGTPPYCAFMVYSKGRVFGAGDSNYPMRVWFSNVGDPEVWPENNYIDINKGDGEIIRAIRMYSNSLIIHKNDGKGQGSIWMLYMPDTTDVTEPSNWSLIKSPSAYGGVSNKAIAFFSNYLMFLNRYGAFAFAGDDVALSAADSSVGRFAVDSHSFNIEPDIKDIKDTIISGSAGIMFDNKVWLSVPKGSTSVGNNTIYTYDFVRASEESRQIGAWSKITAPYINCFAEHNGELYGGSSSGDGYVYQLNTGTTADGASIDSYFTTISIAGLPEHTEYTKVWRYLEILVSTPGSWDLEVTYWVDFYNSVGTTENISLNNGQSLYGTAVYGVDSYSSGTDRVRKRIVLNNAVGKNIKIKFRTNGASEYFKLHELELKYMLRRIR